MGLMAAPRRRQHNGRVDNWMKIAKAVIPGPNVDLLLLPHNSDNTLTMTPVRPAPAHAAVAAPGVAHSAVRRMTLSRGGYYPIVNTSVTFRPGTVSGDATPATTSDYTSAGRRRWPAIPASAMFRRSTRPPTNPGRSRTISR